MKIKKEIQKNVIYDYLNTNLKVFEIADKYKLCRQSIRNIILENGENLKEHKINSKIENLIINDYKNNITNKTLTKKYGLHRCTIQTILLRNDVKLKSLGETARKHQIINENYFNDINTEEKAYILGLLYADGYINKNGFGITLMEDDKELLEKLSIVMYNKIVLYYKKARKYRTESKYICKPQYSFEITSKTMKNDLIKHGCMQAKTFKIRFPELMNENIYRGFIRGYFDGDGCLCIPTNHPLNIAVTITSNTNFCDGLADYVKNVVGVNMKSCIRYKDIGEIRLTGGQQVRKFMNWLYDDATIFMKRKYTKFKSLT